MAVLTVLIISPMRYVNRPKQLVQKCACASVTGHLNLESSIAYRHI